MTCDRIHVASTLPAPDTDLPSPRLLQSLPTPLDSEAASHDEQYSMDDQSALDRHITDRWHS
jgi:hypothetical protein